MATAPAIEFGISNLIEELRKPPFNLEGEEIVSRCGSDVRLSNRRLLERLQKLRGTLYEEQQVREEVVAREQKELEQSLQQRRDYGLLSLIEGVAADRQRKVAEQVAVQAAKGREASMAWRSGPPFPTLGERVAEAQKQVAERQRANPWEVYIAENQ